MNLTYMECMHMKADLFAVRCKLITFAKHHGIKAAAREFGCSRNTVRKWLRRAVPRKPSSIRELSRAPKSCPHRIPETLEKKICNARVRTGFGAERLQRTYDLPASKGTVYRVFKTHGLVVERKKKHKTKKRLREVKKKMYPMQQISADTKYLTDIPYYWAFMTHLRLPRFQYTARDVASGLTFTGYGQENSKTYMCLFVSSICRHLQACGVELARVTWQTDNGAENLRSEESGGLPDLLARVGSSHRYIPPKAHTWQSDVETVHRLVEDEFFDRESFASAEDFWRKVRQYWHWFNIVRENRAKEWKAPCQLIDFVREQIHPGIATFHALDLDHLFAQSLHKPKPLKGGHHVPGYP